MTSKPLIGVLETGRPPEEFNGRFPTYPVMFEDLLSGDEKLWDFKAFSVLDGDFPEAPDQCDAWMVTGSRFGVYEDHAWIPPLKTFIAQAFEQAIPIVGICFGHQIVNEALGGTVVKSEKGWGVGRHTYTLNHSAGHPVVQAPQGRDARFVIQAYHQDQIIALPEGAETLASSPFCDHAVVAYGDRALSFQGHPEFSGAFVDALLKIRRGKPLPEDLADQAMEDVHGPLDTGFVAHWINHFFKQTVTRSTA